MPGTFCSPPSCDRRSCCGRRSPRSVSHHCRSHIYFCLRSPVCRCCPLLWVWFCVGGRGWFWYGLVGSHAALRVAPQTSRGMHCVCGDAWYEEGGRPEKRGIQPVARCTARCSIANTLLPPSSANSVSAVLTHRAPARQRRVCSSHPSNISIVPTIPPPARLRSSPPLACRLNPYGRVRNPYLITLLGNGNYPPRAR